MNFQTATRKFPTFLVIHRIVIPRKMEQVKSNSFVNQKNSKKNDTSQMESKLISRDLEDLIIHFRLFSGCSVRLIL